MKLSDILVEDVGGFVVYRVDSPNTPDVYYGYGQGDLKRTFIAGAKRNAADRTEARFVDLAGGEENLKFVELDVFDSEYEAFMERNDLRAKDPDSITGPSNFPASMFERARTENPERVKRWKLDQSLNTMKAREAYNADLSVFNFDDVKALTSADPSIKRQVVADLDALLYPDFKAKYFPNR